VASETTTANPNYSGPARATPLRASSTRPASWTSPRIDSARHP